jgi:crossover junction endodeoxyribonuclease RusA
MLSGSAAVPPGWPLTGRYSVHIGAWFADHRRCDIDNIAKSVLDGLNGVAWRDDSSVDRLEITRCHCDIEKLYVHVSLTEIPASARARKHVSKTLSRAAAAK